MEPHEQKLRLVAFNKCALSFPALNSQVATLGFDL